MRKNNISFKKSRVIFMYSLSILLLILFSQAIYAQMFWNQAATFDGTSSSYIAVRHSSSLNITGDFTIECWIKPVDVNNPSFQTIVNKRLGNNNEGYSLYLNNGKVAIRTNYTTRLIGNMLIPNNNWSHIAATYNSSTGLFAVYVNGSFDSSVTVSGVSPNPSTDSLTIGVGFNDPFAGEIDEMRIWNRYLTTTEIFRYHRSSLGAGGSIYDGLVMSLTFQNRFSNISRFTLNDFSLYNNDGLNRGVTTYDMSDRPSLTISLNQSVELDGINDWLAGPDNSYVSPITAATFEAWIYTRDNTKTQVIMAKGEPSLSASYLMGIIGTKLAGLINGTTINSNIIILQDEWIHVAFNYNSVNGMYQFFIDGVLKESGTQALGAINDNTDSLFVGGSQTYVKFDGFIDEVRIANYIKTEQMIKEFLYKSIDNSNEPNSGYQNVVYNFDGITMDNADAGPTLYFRNGARFSHPSTISNRPISPLNRADMLHFSEGYYIKTSERLIPQSGTTGFMITDSLYINQSVPITDLNFFLATNHTGEADLEITLVAPNGDSVRVCFDRYLVDQADNLITIFDDNTDSSLVNGRYTTFGPVIKPQNSLNTVFFGNNSKGFWRLRIFDDLSGNSGKLYAWGIQINNQSAVGVEEIISELPIEYRLYQNFPNPFNPTTIIRFDLPANSIVTLKIYDVLGREVKRLIDREENKAGIYKIEFDSENLASGIYFYSIFTENEGRKFLDVKKMILVK